jgi:hypothetical protein
MVARGWGSHIFWHSAHRWRQGCQPYAPAAFLPPGSFLVLISVRGWVDPRAILRPEGLGKLKKSASSGTRTGDFSACSIVPQPTTLPRASGLWTMQWGVVDVSLFIRANEDIDRKVRFSVTPKSLRGCSPCHVTQVMCPHFVRPQRPLGPKSWPTSSATKFISGYVHKYLKITIQI